MLWVMLAITLGSIDCGAWYLSTSLSSKGKEVRFLMLSDGALIVHAEQLVYAWNMESGSIQYIHVQTLDNFA